MIAPAPTHALAVLIDAPAPVNALVQQTGPSREILDMMLGASPPTHVVLGVLGLFSVVSLWVIIAKVRHFRRVRADGDRFVAHLGSVANLGEAYQAVQQMTPSPYTRLFQGGLGFFDDLCPGALGGFSPTTGLSLTQLEALRMVIDKIEAEEIDDLAHGLNWLAVIGSVSPLLGLLGTVIGVMNTFIGITRAGSANIGAVAPGVAEALITTVVGLAVAIPSVIAYNHFASRLNLVLGEFQGFASEFIGSLAKDGHV